MRGDRRGLATMERGVELLQRDPLTGFTTRGLRKLAAGYGLVGDIRHALRYASQAHERSAVEGSSDQVDALERFAAWIKKRKWAR